MTAPPPQWSPRHDRRPGALRRIGTVRPARTGAWCGGARLIHPGDLVPTPDVPPGVDVLLGAHVPLGAHVLPRAVGRRGRRRFRRRGDGGSATVAAVGVIAVLLLLTGSALTLPAPCSPVTGPVRPLTWRRWRARPR